MGEGGNLGTIITTKSSKLVIFYTFFIMLLLVLEIEFHISEIIQYFYIATNICLIHCDSFLICNRSS